ncbi:hypothetical protein TYRP_004912 [Tyrophagus putrescentiae]|nr:hypothetical protein TYRP_004912 [Tyrophagus putrescentiae]
MPHHYFTFVFKMAVMQQQQQQPNLHSTTDDIQSFTDCHLMKTNSTEHIFIRLSFGSIFPPPPPPPFPAALPPLARIFLHPSFHLPNQMVT